MSNLAELNFNAAEVEPNAGFEAIPAGNYDVIITESTIQMTKAGTGRYMKLTLQVLSGKYQNRKLFDRLNLWNPNDQAVAIAKGTLSAICRAVNVLTPKDTSELHHKPMTVTVKVGKDQSGNPSNEISSYKPRGAMQTPVPGPAANPNPVPAGQQPPVASPTNVAPWERPAPAAVTTPVG